jgi:hypothetical protein
MTAPAASPSTSDEELYDLAPSPEPATPASAPAHAVHATVPGPQQTIQYQRAEVTAASGADRYFPDRIRDLWLPVALIGGGTVIEFGSALLHGRGSLETAARGVALVGLGMLVNTVLMLVAIFIVAKLRDISFGPLPTALLKLCAISITPGAAAAFVSWLPLGGLIGLIVSFIVYFALIGALFELDESDTWWCVIIVFGVKLLVVFIILASVLRS